MTTAIPDLDWMRRWATAYPRIEGEWTVTTGRRWGSLDPETGVVVPADPGADGALPGLGPALGYARLLGYRIGRRAVLRAADRFIKVVRPRRVTAMVEAHELMAELARPLGVDVPSVLRSHTDGRIELSVVGGTSLHELLRRDRPDSLVEVASGLAMLHRTVVSPGASESLSPHAHDDPRCWAAIVGRARPDLYPELDEIARSLPRLLPRPHRVVHTDLHDKNIFVIDGGLGLIDLDGLGLGFPEDDAANLATHLHFRALQAGLDPRWGSRWAERFTDAYVAAAGGLDRERFVVVRRHTWFRLSCLYRFRRSGVGLSGDLLRLAVHEGEHERNLSAAPLAHRDMQISVR